MKQTILVTGGTGFIGSHTTVELQQAGYEVVIVDNLSNSKIEVLDGIEKLSRLTFVILMLPNPFSRSIRRLRVSSTLRLLKQSERALRNHCFIIVTISSLSSIFLN